MERALRALLLARHFFAANARALSDAQERLAQGNIPTFRLSGTKDVDYSAAIYQLDFKGYGEAGQGRTERELKKSMPKKGRKKRVPDPFMTPEDALAAIAKRKAEEEKMRQKMSGIAKKRYAKEAERKMLSDSAKRRCADPKERARLKKLSDAHGPQGRKADAEARA